MKKHTAGAAALLLSAAMLLCSCGEKKQTKTDALISDIVNGAAAQASSAEKSSSAAPDAAPAAASAQSTSLNEENWEIADLANGDLDIDLTQMNATMIYSVIYDLLVNPGNYYGKSILVDGFFDTMLNEELGVRYYFVVVPDATACCLQGLEFMLPEGKQYPDDYPAVKDDIRIKGVLDHYEEAGQTYAYIKAEYVEKL